MSSGTATVLFTDLVGSTAGRTRLGEEAAEVLRRTHDRLLAGAVEGNGGEVVKHLGDGIMAVFTGAADALSAAVAAQRAIDRHNRGVREAERLEVRVGVSVGDVTHEDDDVFGTPVIEAARLCAAARGSQILAAEVVGILAGSRGGHRLTPVGALELKGLPAPLPAAEVEWKADGTPSVPLPAALGRAGSFRFVGREAELALLEAVWKEASTGERRAVLVAGEAGVGKTRLVAEAARRFHGEGAVVLFGRCEEELGIPYQPFAEALADYVAGCPPAELRGLLGPLGGELARLVPGLSERAPNLAAPLQAEPDTERYRLFEAVREFLTAISETAPTLLVLDDLHWAARPTLGLLTHLIRRSDRARLLVAGTYRDTDLGRGHPFADVLADLRRLPGIERTSLSGLDEAGVVAFVEGVAGHSLDPVGLVVARSVAAETEGNPFFVGEVLRHLAESGATAEVDGQWRVLRPVEELGIPEGVREVVGRRLSRLPETANEVLATAAVIGREFDVGLLSEAADAGPDIVLDALEEAEAARLVAPRPGRPGVYAFAHALVRSTLYEEIPTAGRLRLHRRIGLALERRAGAVLTDLAHHFIEAAALGDAQRAVDYARQAGDRARAGLAFEEAATHYERALSALDLGDGSPDPALRCDLQMALGDALHHARDRRYRQVLAAAADEARGLGDARRLAEVAVAHNLLGFPRPIGRWDQDVVALAEEALAALPAADDPLRAHLLAVLALELASSPEVERRRTLLDEATAMARRLGDRRVLARVLGLRRWADTDPAELAARLAGAEELIALGEELGDVEATWQGRVWFQMLLYERGDVDAAIASADAGEAMIPQLRQPVPAWELAVGRVLEALLRGRLADAEGLMAKARDLGHEAGMSTRTVAAHFESQRLLLLYEQGRPAEAVETAERMLPFASESGTAGWSWRALLGLVYAEAGDEASARVMLEELASAGFAGFLRNVVWLGGMGAAGRVAAALGDRDRAVEIYGLLERFAGRTCWYGPAVFGPMDSVLALLAETLGRLGQAEGHFAASVEFCERMDAPTWLARTRFEWARMLVGRNLSGDIGRARELAAGALAAAEELGMAGVAAQARALLEAAP